MTVSRERFHWKEKSWPSKEKGAGGTESASRNWFRWTPSCKRTQWQVEKIRWDGDEDRLGIELGPCQLLPGGLVVKESTCQHRRNKIAGLIPGSEGNGNPLQYSCLEHFHGQRSLTTFPCGLRGWNTTEWLNTHNYSIICAERPFVGTGLARKFFWIFAQHLIGKP